MICLPCMWKLNAHTPVYPSKPGVQYRDVRSSHNPDHNILLLQLLLLLLLQLLRWFASKVIVQSRNSQT